MAQSIDRRVAEIIFLRLEPTLTFRGGCRSHVGQIRTQSLIPTVHISWTDSSHPNPWLLVDGYDTRVPRVADQTAGGPIETWIEKLEHESQERSVERAEQQISGGVVDVCPLPAAALRDHPAFFICTPVFFPGGPTLRTRPQLGGTNRSMDRRRVMKTLSNATANAVAPGNQQKDRAKARPQENTLS